MIPIKLHNTLTNQLETLSPIHPGEVRIYTCGPTVYAYAHIGNFRTFVFQDILRRFLRSQGLRLLHVMNVTDVDDRIIVNAAGADISIREYTEKYIQAFLDDMAAINLEQPEILARATEHIPRVLTAGRVVALRTAAHRDRYSVLPADPTDSGNMYPLGPSRLALPHCSCRLHRCSQNRIRPLPGRKRDAAC